MIEIKTKLRKWGNSFGVVIPQKALEEQDAQEGAEITIFIQKRKPNLRKLFGTFKFKKPVEQMMREMDEELYND